MRIPAAALVAFSLSVSSPAFGQPDLKDAQPSIDIYNFGQIDAKYYRGAEPEDQDFAALAAVGIKTVIDLQKDGDEDEPGLVESAGMKYIRIPMTTRVPPTSEQLAHFLALVNDPASQPVYVHCKEGRHRTGVMTAVYRMTKDRWTADQAFDEMKDYKFGWDFLHPEFKRFVYGYTAPLDSLAASSAVVTGASR
jgi:tyrosine-protein phosphatase SIW14